MLAGLNYVFHYIIEALQYIVVMHLNNPILLIAFGIFAVGGVIGLVFRLTR